MDIHDENTESDFDSLLRIFDDGNDSVETNFNTLKALNGLISYVVYSLGYI